jgi:hypothetical protein
MVPNSKGWQTFLAMHPCKAEQFTLDLRQRYDSTLAIVPDKVQMHHDLLRALLPIIPRTTYQDIRRLNTLV